MILEYPITGLNYKLRSVTTDDSKEILKLRLDPALNSYLHKTTPEGHQRWIQGQMSLLDDYYFAIEDLSTNQINGFIGLYNVANGSGEWGRWILNSNSMAAMESYWLILRFGFSLDLTSIFCRTDVRNHKVISIHNRLPYSKVNPYRDDRYHLDYLTHTLNISDWPNFENYIKRFIRWRTL